MTSISIQIISLIIAPTFVATAVYLNLKDFVLTIGEHYSLVKAEWYTGILIKADIVSPGLQGAEGAITATVRDLSTIETGEAITIAGICWQEVS